MKARQVFELQARYDVSTPTGERIGVLEKVFGKSILRSTWKIHDANEQELAMAEEKRMNVALLRRIIDAIPYGEFVPVVFQFTIRMDGREVGELRRPIGVRDRYILTIGGDMERRIDRRLVVALGVALDALQSR